MCAVSMVGDHYRDMWEPRPWFPGVLPNTFSPQAHTYPPISRSEFDELKRQVSEMRDLLKRAKDYDERTGQPDCEMDEKMDFLRKVAKLVGFSLDDVIGPAPGAV